jgi:hypothetical protein
MLSRIVITCSLLGIIGSVAVVSRQDALVGWAFGRGNDCNVRVGDAEDGVMPIRAICQWAVPIEAVRAQLDDVERQEHVFSNVDESELISTYGDHLVVRQVHVARGIRDREVIIDWVREPAPSGVRYRWRKASDQSTITPGRVEVAVHSGSWEVSETNKGTRVQYTALYHPGGSVPRLLVRWFQGSGVRGVLEDLHEASKDSLLH